MATRGSFWLALVTPLGVSEPRWRLAKEVAGHVWLEGPTLCWRESRYQITRWLETGRAHVVCTKIRTSEIPHRNKLTLRLVRRPAA